MTVVFAPEKAAEAGDQAHHLTQGWGRFRRRAAMGHDPGRLPFPRDRTPRHTAVRAVPAPGHASAGCARRWPGKSPRPVPTAPASPVAAPRPGSLLSKSGKISISQRLRYQSTSCTTSRACPPAGWSAVATPAPVARSGLFFPGPGSRLRSPPVDVMRRQVTAWRYRVWRTRRAGRSGAAGGMNSTSPVVRPGPAGPQFLPVVVLRLCWDRISQSAGVPRRAAASISARRSPSIRHARPAGYRARFPPDRRRSRSPRPSAGFP